MNEAPLKQGTFKTSRFKVSLAFMALFHFSVGETPPPYKGGGLLGLLQQHLNEIEPLLYKKVFNDQTL